MEYFRLFWVHLDWLRTGSPGEKKAETPMTRNCKKKSFFFKCYLKIWVGWAGGLRNNRGASITGPSEGLRTPCILSGALTID